MAQNLPMEGESPVLFVELWQVVRITRKPMRALEPVNKHPSGPEWANSLLLNDFPLAESSSVFTASMLTPLSA
jgi:hypothetical protein